VISLFARLSEIQGFQIFRKLWP